MDRNVKCDCQKRCCGRKGRRAEKEVGVVTYGIVWDKCGRPHKEPGMVTYGIRWVIDWPDWA